MMIGWLGTAVLVAAMSADASVRVYARLEPPEIPFHRTAIYRICAEVPQEIDPVFPDMSKAIEDLEITPGHITSEPLPDGRRRIEHTYTINPIQAKTHLLPPAEVTWADGGKTIAPGLVFRARALTKEEEEQAGKFEGITGPEEVQSAYSKAPWIAAMATAAILSGVLAAAYLLWWRRQAQVYSEPVVPPWEVAYRRLRELAQRQLPAAGKFEPYYVDLSAILRYYIEDRFHLRAPEQTTPEFLEAAGHSGLLSEDQQGQMARFLRHCDRVKFARYEPSADEMDQSYGVVLRFVQDTEIKPLPEPGQEAAA